MDKATPGTANAFLAWDTLVAAGDAWRWEGEVPLSGRYFYEKVHRGTGHRSAWAIE